MYTYLSCSCAFVRPLSSSPFPNTDSTHHFSLCGHWETQSASRRTYFAAVALGSSWPLRYLLGIILVRWSPYGCRRYWAVQGLLGTILINFLLKSPELMLSILAFLMKLTLFYWICPYLEYLVRFFSKLVRHVFSL